MGMFIILRYRFIFWLFPVFVVIVFSCSENTNTINSETKLGLVTDSCMVVSAHPLASKV